MEEIVDLKMVVFCRNSYGDPAEFFLTVYCDHAAIANGLNQVAAENYAQSLNYSAPFLAIDEYDHLFKKYQKYFDCDWSEDPVINYSDWL